MINVSSAFKNEVFENDNRNYQYEIRITFPDSTYIDLSNEDLMTQGGVVIDEAVSSENTLSVGSCIVNKLTLTLQNFNGEYDAYDFIKANVVLKVGLLVNENLEKFQRGVYIVSEPPTYNTSCVTLVCYDYMSLLDIPYSSASTVYPATISTIINDICTACNIQRETQELPHDSLSFSANPFSDVTTCREALSYIAQINCRNCRMTPLGKLEFVWFSDGFTGSSAIARKTQEDAVRSVENNVVRVTYYQSSGDVSWLNQVEIPAIYSLDMAKQNTVVTGVRIVIPAVEDDELGTIDTYETGTSDYLISVESNPLTNASNADSILATLASLLLGFRYRKSTVSHLGMPWMMAGDSGVVADSTGARRNIIISTTTFTSLDRQSTRSAGADNVVSTASRYSPETTQIVKTMDSIKPVIRTLNQRIANANGLYETQQTTQGGATITYMHNKPLLAESDIQIMISDVGVMVTANGTSQSPTWYGLEVNGNLIANILSANGINADWINTGALIIRDSSNNIVLKIDATNKQFYWSLPQSEMTNEGRMYLYDDGTLGRLSSFSVESDDTSSPWPHDYLYRSSLRSTELRIEHSTTNTEAVLLDTGISIGGGNYGQILSVSPTASRPGYASETHCVISNKDLEEWIQRYSRDLIYNLTDVDGYYELSSGANLNNIAAKPGIHVAASYDIGSTLTNGPSGYKAGRYEVKRSLSDTATYFVTELTPCTFPAQPKRARYSQGSNYGSWRAVSGGEATFTVNTTNFSVTRSYVRRNGNIVSVMLVLSAAKAHAAGTAITVGTLSPRPGLQCGVWCKSGTATMQNGYLYSQDSNNLAMNPVAAIASGAAVEFNFTYGSDY